MLQAIKRDEFDVTIAADPVRAESPGLSLERFDPFTDRPFSRNECWNQSAIGRCALIAEAGAPLFGSEIASESEWPPHDRRALRIIGQRFEPQRLGQA